VEQNSSVYKPGAAEPLEGWGKVCVTAALKISSDCGVNLGRPPGAAEFKYARGQEAGVNKSYVNICTMMIF